MADFVRLQLSRAGLHGDGAPGRGGVDGVGQDVDEYLLNLVAVQPDERKASGQVLHQFDSNLAEGVPDQADGLFEDGAEVFGMGVQRMWHGKVEQTQDDAVGALDGVGHIRENEGHVFVGGIEVFGEVIGAHAEDSEGVFHLVSHSGGQAADGLHLLSLDELELGGLEVFVRFLEVGKGLLQFIFVPGEFRVGLLEGFFRELALGDITADAHQADGFALGIAQQHFGRGMPAFVPKTVRNQFLPVQERVAR